MLINYISQEDILWGVVTIAMPIISRQMGGELLSLEVCKYVSIPMVIKGDLKEIMFIW